MYFDMELKPADRPALQADTGICITYGGDVGLTRLFRTRRLQPPRQNSNTIMSKESKKN